MLPRPDVLLQPNELPLPVVLLPRDVLPLRDVLLLPIALLRDVGVLLQPVHVWLLLLLPNDEYGR